MDLYNGFVGLSNLGNTCFLNSCIQVLNHTYELHEIVEKSITNSNPDTTILNEWNELRKVMWSGNGIVSPNRFVHNVHTIARQKNRDIFTGWVQNDITEFLLFLMDCMHNSLSKKLKIRINGNPENQTDKIAVACYDMLKTVYAKEYSEIMDVFYGIYVTTIVNPKTGAIHSIRPEQFFVLDLQIFLGDRVCPSIYECFDLFTSQESMSGENAWYNESTGQKEHIHRSTQFWNFPKVLVITLKRFSPDGSQKINNLIDFPLENLDVSKYVIGYNAKSYMYDLFGVCNHIGGVSGGHYTAFAKHKSGQWAHYDDSNVEMINDPRQVVSPMAYCLFYRKKNTLS